METGLEGREAHVDAGRSVRVLQVVCRIAGLRPCQAGTCISWCERVRTCACVCVFVCSTRHHRQRVVHINKLASLNIKEGR